MTWSKRVAQRWDDIHIELRLLPSTEEWAEELFKRIDGVETAERTEKGLVVKFVMAGNCDGASNLSSFMSEVEDAMQEGDISLNEFEVKVTAVESSRS